MNYYPIISQIPELKGSVGVCNFPNNESVSVVEAQVYATFSTGDKWHIRSLGSIKPYEIRTVYVDDIDDVPQGASVFVFMYNKSLPPTLDELIIDPFLTSSPDWRANLKLSSATTATSYQGEYPDGMLPLSKSTLVSLCPLVQSEAHLSNKVVLFNMTREPEIRQSEVMLVSVQTGECLSTFQTTTNAVNILDLPPTEGDVYLACTSMVGIPLYLTHSHDFSVMSFEHSHPPHEFTFGGYTERHGLIRSMKRWWLTHAKV